MLHSTFYNLPKVNDLLHIVQSGLRNLFSWETEIANILNKWSEFVTYQIKVKIKYFIVSLKELVIIMPYSIMLKI